MGKKAKASARWIIPLPFIVLPTFDYFTADVGSMESLPNFSFRAFFPKERDDMIRIGSKEVPLPTIERTQCQN